MFCFSFWQHAEHKRRAAGLFVNHAKNRGQQSLYSSSSELFTNTNQPKKFFKGLFFWWALFMYQGHDIIHGSWRSRLKKASEGFQFLNLWEDAETRRDILHHQITKATAHKSKASKLNLEDKLSSLWDLKQWSQKTIENHTFFEYVKYLAHVTYHNAYNLLLFYRKIEIGVELMNGYDKSKGNF